MYICNNNNNYIPIKLIRIYLFHINNKLNLIDCSTNDIRIQIIRIAGNNNNIMRMTYDIDPQPLSITHCSRLALKIMSMVFNSNFLALVKIG